MGCGRWESKALAISLFGKKGQSSGDEGGGDDGATGASNSQWSPQPEKAQVFFDRARTVHDTANYEYAMTLWLQGLRLDPSNMTALEAFFDSAANFNAKQEKSRGPTKDQIGAIEKKGPIDKYLVNILHWGTKPTTDWQAGLRAMEEAAKFDLNEPGYWIGEKVMNIAMNDPKAKKDHFLKMMELFRKIGAPDLAVRSGERALQMDPRDAKLVNTIRNLSAEATMSRGGYSKTGQEGGFRANIRDQGKQQDLVDSDQVIKTEAAMERLIAAAADDYKSRPTDPNAIQKLGKLLLERGTADDEKTVIKLYLKGHKETQSYRFKALAGDIQMRIARRRLRALEQKVRADPDNAQLREQFEKGQRQVLEFERDEFTERVANYPTDLKLKFELGLRYFQLGEYEEAIQQFQLAQGASGIGTIVLSYLGRCFEALGWVDEAEGTFRRAIEEHGSDADDTATELRYGLMKSLQSKAEQQRDLQAADEAFRLASGIAIKQINYRDVRDRRTVLQELVKQLRQEAKSGG